MAAENDIMIKAPVVNREAFEHYAKVLESGEYQLTFDMLGDIFGRNFWVMIVYALMDAGQAARAIEGAMRRLSGRES